MNIVLCLSHAIEEANQLELLSGLGYGVFSIGGYIDPAHPHDPKRPALPDVPFFPELKKAVDDLGTADNLGAAQAHIPEPILEWADVLIFHHYLEPRLTGQWPRIREWLRGGKRVIWRSVGQSVEHNELTMAPLRSEGLERVAYSPKEANIPGYSGHDALIRFWVDPEEWSGWTGEELQVINVTQHLRQREPYTNWRFWDESTRGLPAVPLGPGSELIGGPGALPYDALKEALRSARCYLYTGTQPASYTLGLIEAMMTGIPVVSIGPAWMRVFPYGPRLFEGHELATSWSNDPDLARVSIEDLLNDRALAVEASQDIRQRAIELFGKETIVAQWKAYLG